MVGPQDENGKNFRRWYTRPHDGNTGYLEMSELAKQGIWHTVPNNEILSNKGALILPFYSELESARLVAMTARRLYSDSQLAILPISAKPCEETEKELLDASFPVYRQKDLLKAVQWDKLVKQRIIPPSTLDLQNHPTGQKGLTMLTGTLAALAQGMESICFHDTDVINPLEYGALEALPKLLFSHKPYDCCMMALVGPFRHNETWTIHAGIEANDDRNHPDVRQIAKNLQRLIWPLSGERGYSTQCIRKLPFTFDMGVETIFDVAFCEHEFRENSYYIQQVLGNINKKENGKSEAPRENGLIGLCVDTLMRALRYLNSDTNARVWGMDLKGAAAINAKGSGEEMEILVQSETIGEQTPVVLRHDIFIPCIDELDKGGFINWKVIKDIIN
jgi:hypothetical protein